MRACAPRESPHHVRLTPATSPLPPSRAFPLQLITNWFLIIQPLDRGGIQPRRVSPGFAPTDRSVRGSDRVTSDRRIAGDVSRSTSRLARARVFTRYVGLTSDYSIVPKGETLSRAIFHADRSRLNPTTRVSLTRDEIRADATAEAIAGSGNNARRCSRRGERSTGAPATNQRRNQKYTRLVSQSNYGKLAGVKSPAPNEQVPTSKRREEPYGTDGRTGRGKHKLRWGTDYEARAGYHYPSHRDRSTLQQPRLLSAPRALFRSLSSLFLSPSLSLLLSFPLSLFSFLPLSLSLFFRRYTMFAILLPRAPIMPGWETANY